ncbi:MAG: hypothetical protein Q7L19_00520 [Pseudohongiella sp.]|nr:hypothetical protein [Pseudohongiella sp.]
MNDVARQEHASSHRQQCLALQLRLEELINSRIEPLNLMMLALLPASRRTFRVTRGEQGFSVHFCGNIVDDTIFTKTLHEELSAAIAAIQNSCHPLSSASATEKLVIAFRKILRRVVDSTIAPALQKGTINILSGIQIRLAGRVKDARKYHSTRLEVLSHLLQEPQSTVADMLRSHQYYLQWNYARRLRHLRQSDDGSFKQTFCWPERDAYVAMSRDCDDSRVLVSIHMGDFFGAFRAIADALDQSRSVISLRREGDTDSIRTLSRRHAAGHRVYMHGKENPVTIVRALRAGGQTLSVMFDLGRDFGETTEALFFGHRARFVRGPAELAIMGRARIYPFVSYSEDGRDWIRMEPAFVPELRPGESLQDATSRVTQTLVTLAERWIRQYPAQWKYLDTLPSYLANENSGQQQEVVSHAR